jgi:Flp pilus assembly protein TadG
MSTFWKACCRHLAAFRVSRKGNVAVTFAFATVPVILFVGAAIDYSRANAIKAAMQTVLDSTALMLSKDAATLSQDDLNTKATSYFTANFNEPNATDVVVKATYAADGGTHVIVNGSLKVPTTFMGVAGYQTITLNNSSMTEWGNSRLRVALVLDNTGSMKDDGKLDALKTATKNLLTQLQNAVSTPGDVYVSIIPFVKDVSVDTSDYISSWDNWIQWDDGTDKSWDGANGTCTISGKSRRSTCTSSGTCSNSNYTNQGSCTSSTGNCSIPGYDTQSSCTSAGVCSKPWYTTKSYCQNNSGTWTTGVWTAGAGAWTAGVWTHSDHSTWNGCFTDRGTSTAPGTSAGYDQDVTEPTSSIAATLFPAEQYSACPKPMLGLNYDWSNMATYVDGMSANGNTNQPIGLVWGWQSLVGGGPFSVPALDASYNYQKIIILLSDGMNTQDRWYNDQSSIDNRMLDSTTGNGTCANIKAAGITIYTIQVNTGSDPTSSLLKNCASNSAGTSDHFFLLTSADQIVTAFNTIGSKLTQLRIAQ